MVKQYNYHNRKERLDMEKNIFEILMEHALNERFDEILFHDEEYRRLQNNMDKLLKNLDELSLSNAQMMVVDKLLAAHVESGNYYGKMAYQQGIRDCVLLLSEMGLLKIEQRENNNGM